MERKKWTAKTEVTEELLKFREKRKWQLALRRYVLERKASATYAPYFGLDVNGFREWIEVQFTEDLNWGNFATAWQFDHIVPVTYFDFSREEDLYLCWNFMNIRVQRVDLNKNGEHRIAELAVKPYFTMLFKKTGYGFCSKMLRKLEEIEDSNIGHHTAVEHFIIERKEHLETIASLTREEFERFNEGTAVKDILLEREILKKFGG